MKTKVVNVKFEECDVYIGRDSDKKTHLLTHNMQIGEKGWLGNPHVIGWCERCGASHNREESIKYYEIDFLNKLKNDIKFNRSVTSLKGKRLGCFCKPLACHGDVIVKWIEFV